MSPRNLKRKSGRIKRFWRGRFSLNCTEFIMYCYAWSEVQAKEMFIRRIAKEQDVAFRLVRSIFDGSTDNYKIEQTEKEKDWRSYNGDRKVQQLPIEPEVRGPEGERQSEEI